MITGDRADGAFDSPGHPASQQPRAEPFQLCDELRLYGRRPARFAP